MADLIQADYEQLGEIASRFHGQSEATAQMWSRVNKVVDTLKNGGWIGTAADAFFAELEADVLPAVNRLGEALQEASTVTNQIVAMLNQADENASSPFRNETGTPPTSPGPGAGSGPGVSAPGDVGDIPVTNMPIGMPPNGTIGVNPGDNDYGIPRDWLSDVTDGLPGGGEPDSNWLDKMRDTLGLPDSGSGGGSGGDSGSGGETGGGGSGSGSTGGGSGSGGSTGGGSTGSGGGSTGSGSGSGSGAGGGDTSGSGSGGGAPSAGTSPYQTPGEAGFRAGMGAQVGGGIGAGGANFAAGSGIGGGSQGESADSMLGRAGSAADAAATGDSLGSMGVPLGIAAVSPFLALLGKALKDNKDDR